jgi:hypothetical protein
MMAASFVETPYAGNSLIAPEQVNTRAFTTLLQGSGEKRRGGLPQILP